MIRKFKAAVIIQHLLYIIYYTSSIIHHLLYNIYNKTSIKHKAGFRSSEAPSNCDCRALTAPYPNYINNFIKRIPGYRYSAAFF